MSYWYMSINMTVKFLYVESGSVYYYDVLLKALLCNVDSMNDADWHWSVVIETWLQILMEM